jgi:hypothetical protein
MNAELLALYAAGRAARVDQPRIGTPEYTAMRERDTLRRLRAAAIESALEAPEAADLYHAALLFQHGDEPQDAWRAYQLAREATERSEGASDGCASLCAIVDTSAPERRQQQAHRGLRHDYESFAGRN